MHELASGVITEKLGPHQRPVAYYSMQIDLAFAGAPACIKSVAAAGTILEQSCPHILGYFITVYVCPT